MIRKIFRFFSLLLLMLPFFINEADAFPEQERGWIPGVMGGLNYATVHSLPEGYADPIIGYTGGIFMERHLASEVVFRPQVLYTQKGFKVDEVTEEDEVIDFRYDGEYIDVATPIIYSFELHSEFVPQILVAPTMSFGLSGEFDGDFGENETPEGYNDDFSFFDFGGMVAAGGIQHFSNFAVTIDVRYQWGFLDMDIHEDGSIRNQGARLHIGIRF